MEWGKASTVSGHFKELGFPIFDADAVVHKLYSRGGDAVEPIRQLFPYAIVDSAVNRPILGSKVLGNYVALKNLEDIVHPLVAAERQLFLLRAEQLGHFLCVYDIPLLLENRQNYSVDCVVVATADETTQRMRVLQRPGMTIGKFESILAKQMPDEEKRRNADFLIRTDFPGFAPAKAQVAHTVEQLISSYPTQWRQWKTRKWLRFQEEQTEAGENTIKDNSPECLGEPL